MAALAQGNNTFALILYGKLRTGQSGNIIFSPGSISTALAMTYAGARGETAGQMREVLQFSLPPERLHPAFASLEDSLGEEVSVANRLWGQQGERLLEEFLAITRDHYGAELEPLDFRTRTEADQRYLLQRAVGEPLSRTSDTGDAIPHLRGEHRVR